MSLKIFDCCIFRHLKHKIFLGWKCRPLLKTAFSRENECFHHFEQKTIGTKGRYACTLNENWNLKQFFFKLVRRIVFTKTTSKKHVYGKTKTQCFNETGLASFVWETTCIIYEALKTFLIQRKKFPLFNVFFASILVSIFDSYVLFLV